MSASAATARAGSRSAMPPGFINPMNGEGIDYGLESGMLAVDLFLDDPATAPARYDRLVGERFDAFLRTGRRFSFLIGHP